MHPREGRSPSLPEARTRRGGLAPVVSAALALALGLAGCGEDPDKATERAAKEATARVAAPLTGAFDALGLDGLAWERAWTDAGAIHLGNARATLRGVGPVTAAEITVRGFAGSAENWAAQSVLAEGVAGAASADRIVVQAPRARRDGKAWSVTRLATLARNYKGPLLGAAVASPDLGIEEAPPSAAFPASTRIHAREAAVAAVAGGPLAPYAGRTWEAAVRVLTPAPGRVVAFVDRLSSDGYSLKGRFEFAGGPNLAGEIGAMDLAAFADPARWPADAALAGLEAEVELARPRAVIGTGATDPALRPLDEAAAKGAVTWRLAANPKVPVPVRDIPAVLAASDGAARLGLAVQGTGAPAPGPVPSVAGAPAPQPSTYQPIPTPPPPSRGGAYPMPAPPGR